MNSLFITPSGSGPVRRTVVTKLAVNGASVTATGIIPAGAIPIGIATEIITALTGSVTGYSVGDGSDIDRWGVAAAKIIGTKTNNADWTTSTIQMFNTAQDIVLTPTTANFNGTGAIVITVDYLTNVP